MLIEGVVSGWEMGRSRVHAARFGAGTGAVCALY